MTTKVHEGRVNPFDHDLLQRAHRTFIQFYQGYFAGSPPGDLRWSENDEETGIYIAADAEPPKGRSMPGIMVKVAPAAWAGLSIDSTPSQNFQEHTYEFGDNVNCSVVVSCVDKTEVAARFLGWRAFTAIRVFKRLLVSGGTIQNIHNTFQLSPPIPGDILDKAFAGRYATQLVIPFIVRYEASIADANEDFKVRAKSIVAQSSQV